MCRSTAQLVARLVIAVGIVWGLYFLRVNAWFRLYPVAVVTVVLATFSVSLWRMPMVEVFARRMGESLDERGVAYCRNVTRIWVAFLSVHLAVTVATVFAPHVIWAWYNGCVAYLLMGALFVGEWIYRKKVRHG